MPLHASILSGNSKGKTTCMEGPLREEMTDVTKDSNNGLIGAERFQALYLKQTFVICTNGGPMKKVLSLSVFLLLFVAAPAVAQGPYLGGGFVYSIIRLAPTSNICVPGRASTSGSATTSVPWPWKVISLVHDITTSDPGYGHADFGGFSIDLRVFLSPQNATEPGLPDAAASVPIPCTSMIPSWLPTPS